MLACFLTVYIDLAWMGPEVVEKYIKHCGTDWNSCTVSTYSYLFVTT